MTYHSKYIIYVYHTHIYAINKLHVVGVCLFMVYLAMHLSVVCVLQLFNIVMCIVCIYVCL